MFGLALFAWVAAAGAKPKGRAPFWGAAEGEAERGRIGQWESGREEYAGYVVAVAGPEFERARADRRTMSLDEAVAYALSLD